MSGQSRAVLSGLSRHRLCSTRKDSPVQSRAKRRLVIVACNACRKRKVKCDGSRPVCSRCSTKRADCTWLADPDTTPMLALKQRYQILDTKCRNFHGLMQLLIHCPRQQAFIILDNLRETRDVSLILSLVGSDDSFVNLTNTADFHSISSNSTTSVHGYLRHVPDMTPLPSQGRHSSSANPGKPHPGGSHSPMRRLAISDLINTENT